jgi:hypothetical protein
MTRDPKVSALLRRAGEIIVQINDNNMTKEEIQSCIDHIDRIWENLKDYQNLQTLLKEAP